MRDCEMSVGEASQPTTETFGYWEQENIDGLYQCIHKNPKFLQDVDEFAFVHTPLHEAAAKGNAMLCMEIMTLMPSFGKKLNCDGLSPLHLAIQNDHQDTAMALVKFDKELVRIKGKEGFTPLHYVVKFQGHDNNLLAHILGVCPDSVKDLNCKFQTALHVALESNKCHASVILLRWIERRARESVIHWKDYDGNTPLHTAAQYNCVEGVSVLVKLSRLNKRNNARHTPLDIAIQHRNEQIEKILRDAKAVRSQDLYKKQSFANYLYSETTFLEKILRGYYFLIKDLSLDMRNCILVVAVLITTATYQAVLQPPGGVYQGNAPETATKITARISSRAVGAMAPPPRPLQKQQQLVGKMVMGKDDYVQFMPANTIAFTLSLIMIIFVLHGRPYNIILHVCLIFLAYGYFMAMVFVSNRNGMSHIMFFVCWYMVAGAFLVKMLYYVIKGMLEDMWYLPRFGIKASNVSDLTAPTGRAQETISIARRLKKQYQLIKS